MINICIHGHFYQPPRENPWNDEIELQPGAKPYHDWNEKIYYECYKPNSEAEIVNEKGETVSRINNYEHINFNFGPTLLEWIKRKHPNTYKKIIEADKQSIKAHNGHGNAIAMCYNHMIMPLANFNDMVTQVKWGLEDFKYHFGRSSEGIWLPETACNDETIEVLIKEEIKYIILDTGQASFVRKAGSDQWLDVNDNGINPKLPYKRISQTDKEKFINIFFYDGPVSKAVAFDDVLTSSAKLLEKTFNAADKNISEEQIISIATDGETFGHHKKFAERTLAYFITGLAPESNLKIVNFGEYLELHPAEYEVRLKKGKNNQGTSWSCPHGVERWLDDCGCGSSVDMNQKWRKPLREALNWLRDQLIIVYQQHGSLYMKDVWDARNDYIKVILNNNSETKNEFIERNSVKKLDKAEIDSCFKLLEMQKYAMLMFTSCGWFFSEISGFESIKILEYGSRANYIGEEIARLPIEKYFVQKLSEAKSNIKDQGTGKEIYMRMVKPNTKTLPQLSNNGL